MPKRGRKALAPKQKIDPIVQREAYRKFDILINEATKTSKTHDKYLREAKRLFQNENDDIIASILIKQTKKHLALGDDNPQVVCFMEFMAVFMYSLDLEQSAIFNMSHRYGCAEMHIVMKNIFKFCITISDADANFIRKLSLQFINIILDKMGDGTLEDELFDDLTKCVMERMQDTQFKVRVQAMYAAKRLQEPRDPDDNICKAYRFHMKCDPSISVRRAILGCIGCTVHNIESIIWRTQDCDEGIRKLAYERLTEVNMRVLNLKQRQDLLKRAFNDTSKKIRFYIDQTFIPIWTEQSDNSLLNLFDTVRYDMTDADKEAYDEVAMKLMESLYANHSLAELCAQLGLDDEFKLIPVQDIKVHTLVYWRCLATCMQKDGADLDLVLPVLTFFVDLMEKHDSTYGHVMEQEVVNNDIVLDQIEFRGSRLELLRMTKLFDKSDEVGRTKLKAYLLKLLANEKNLNEHHIREIVIILKEICITFAEWQQELLNIVMDIYKPVMPGNTQEVAPVVPLDQRAHEDKLKKTNLRMEIIGLERDLEDALAVKDYDAAKVCDSKITELKTELEKLHNEGIILAPPADIHIEEETREVTTEPKELVRAFMILYYMVSEFHYRLTPELRIMQQDVIHPQIKSEFLQVEFWALKCCACMCLEDLGYAKQYFPVYYIHLYAAVPEEAADKWNLSDLALAAIFDFFTAFSMQDFLNGETSEQNSTGHRRLYPNRTELDCSDEEDEVDGDGEGDQTAKQGGFVEIIIKLLQDCEVHSTRLIVIKGLAKLFLNNKIESKKVLGMLLLMYHHPEMDTPACNDLRQYIVMIFAELSAGSGGGPAAIVYSLLPALKIWSEAPPESPLQQIETWDISKFVLTLTAVNIPGENFHSLLALTICDELKRMRRDEEMEIMLTRTLASCKMTGDEQLKNDLKNCMETLIPSLASRNSEKYIRKALSNLEQPDETQATVQEENENVDETNDQQMEVDEN